jgi:hypothetical protein
MSFETTTYEAINNTHILTMFGDVMTYNELKDLPLDLTTKLKVSFNRSVVPTMVKVWFDDEIVMDWKPMQGHHDLFYHLQALDEENEDTEDETDYETEEEEEEANAGKPICCFCSAECLYYGNNPAPLAENGVCCDGCNEAVVFARMGMDKLARSMLDKRITEKVEKLVSDL